MGPDESSPRWYHPTIIPKPATGNIYQLKITLGQYKPRIWRRIQVPDDFTFAQLHECIQDSMGWVDCHLHEFTMADEENGSIFTFYQEGSEPPHCYSEATAIAEEKAGIAQYFTVPGKSFAKYIYDYGDGWKHKVLLEKILPAKTGVNYPYCINGKRACPPEDIGGTDGYKQLLEVLSDPNNSEYEEMKAWLFEVKGQWPFEPETFDPRLVCFGAPAVPKSQEHQETLNL